MTTSTIDQSPMKFAGQRAKKHTGYLIEPLIEGPMTEWQNHHATNPCCVRLTGDPRVFLGFRAGGNNDRFICHGAQVWASHLGLAILDATGGKVVHRLPLPIMAIDGGVALPQTTEEFEAFQNGPHVDEISVLHDFRFWEDGDWLYVIFHEGTATKVFDSIVRMRRDVFLEKIAESIALLDLPEAEIRAAWREIWWLDGTWAACGANGTRRIYSSPASKNDVVFIRLKDESLRLYHRPVPDIAILDTDGKTWSSATPDGITEFGVLQTCIRPGLPDNSHVGNNGTPILAKIGKTEVFIDIVHGVYNRQISCPEGDEKWRLTYLPYIRILDAQTGACLYYSEDQVLDVEGGWEEFMVHGEWIKKLDHLDAVMFAGGQIERVAGKIGLDDDFLTYVGVGDTAVALAEFRLRDLLPSEVIDDIAALGAHPIAAKKVTSFTFPEPLCGWKWSIESSVDTPTFGIVRQLTKDGSTERAFRPVELRPGFFDANGLYFNGTAVRNVDGLGWVLAYRGIRCSDGDGSCRMGYGLLLLDPANPERIFYRSHSPIEEEAVSMDAWRDGAGREQEILADAEVLIPDIVQAETRRIYQLCPMPSDMTKWLESKAAKTC
jgi:predicted GH43/DUF377 family glycosyl hydrolase